MFIKDVLKTLLRYFGRWVIIGFISFPGTILVGLLEQANPIFKGTVPILFYYFFCILFAYRRGIKDLEVKDRYKNCIISDKYYYVAESARIVRDEFYALATYAVSFWILYIFSRLTFMKNAIYGFEKESPVVSAVTTFIICITFPLFDVLIQLFIRKKWFKEYDEFRKEAKFQEFHE